MKHLLISSLTALLLILTACAPVQPAASDDSTPGTTSEPSPTPATPDSTEDSPEVEETPTPEPDMEDASWDTNPEALIISATFCCGFVPQSAVINYIPDAQVWGDGRIVWVEQSDDGTRRVLEGQLSLEELGLLIERIQDAGFFEWEDRYANQQVADYADKCINVNLVEQQKSVCEYYEGAPAEFHEIYDVLSTGAGASGEAYMPETGFLTVIPLGPTTQINPADVAGTWDAAEMGISLSEVGEGVWVEGPALEAAWAAVNFRPWNPMVQEGENYYLLGLQIPNLSMAPPPS
ncbi:MAG TPA: hypothetical protein VJ768_10595 [Anaerolineales bacterium]|nr:hypothetical protein [Anaerolineales bacterium]